MRQYYLQQMGITPWVLREAKIRPPLKLAAEDEVRGEAARRTLVYTQVHEDSSTDSTKQFASALEFQKRSIDEKNLTDLALEVSACVRCPLHETRKQTVFARGNPNAKLMIIGEAPGFYEDQQGLPFVGKAGGLLNKMLNSIGLSNEDVYIANVLKCRPPNNRDPKPEEINQCCDYLSQQIDLIAPKLILALGRFAGQFLLQATLPLNKMRRKVHDYKGIPTLVSYHPAYLLRNSADKKNAYTDLLQTRQLLIS